MIGKLFFRQGRIVVRFFVAFLALMYFTTPAWATCWTCYVEGPGEFAVCIPHGDDYMPDAGRTCTPAVGTCIMTGSCAFTFQDLDADGTIISDEVTVAEVAFNLSQGDIGSVTLRQFLDDAGDSHLVRNCKGLVIGSFAQNVAHGATAPSLVF